MPEPEGPRVERGRDAHSRGDHDPEPDATVSTEPQFGRLRPMLASPGRRGDLRDGFAYEFKWDGARALGRVAGGEMTLRSRRGRDVTATYPELTGVGEGLEAVLDGEIVALEQGRPSFSLLQRRMNVTDPGRVRRLIRRIPVALLVFDVLRVGDRWLLEQPYERRREILEGLGLDAAAVQVPPTHHDLDEAVRVAADLGLEGVVAKRLGSTYQPGRRSPDWRKLRLVRRQALVVGGYRPEQGGRPDRIGSLLVGYHDPTGALCYAGAVGSGLTERMRADLGATLERRADSPFADPVPHDDAVFVEPASVVDVRFREWTADGVLRQPSIRGLRPDKSPREVVREPT